MPANAGSLVGLPKKFGARSTAPPTSTVLPMARHARRHYVALQDMSPYLIASILIGFAIGAVACVPPPRKRMLGKAISVALGVAGAVVGWALGLAMGEGDIGPVAEMFFAVIGASAVVALYQAWTSERPTLR